MTHPKVTVIDYKMGSAWSILSAFQYLGAKAELTEDCLTIEQSSYLILPGIGSYRKGMEILNETGMTSAIQKAVDGGAKILGICLGMQLLGSYGTEDGGSEGLSLINKRVEKWSQLELGNNKLPHVGFNTVQISDQSGLFAELGTHPDFYFIHSYRMTTGGVNGRSALCDYGSGFLAAFECGNICGVQFHPEKSQVNGLILLRNFLLD